MAMVNLVLDKPPLLLVSMACSEAICAGQQSSVRHGYRIAERGTSLRASVASTAARR